MYSSTLCPLVFCCCHSLPCFPGSGHYLLLLSQCDNHCAKAAPLQHPQEIEIQCCVCTYSANVSFRWALIYMQRRGRVSAPYSTNAASEGHGEGGEHFRCHTWKCWNSLHSLPPWQGNPSLFASRSAHTTGKLMGWWMRWYRKEEGVSNHCRVHDVAVIIAADWRIRLSSSPLLVLDTYTRTNICSHQHICLHAKVFIQRHFKLKMTGGRFYLATFPLRRHNVRKRICTRFVQDVLCSRECLSAVR